MELTSIQLAVQNTKLANQRTYLAYMRTGFGIAAISGTFKKFYITLFGIVMIFISTTQYLYINKKLDAGEDLSNKNLDLVPILYVLMSLATLYLQFHK